MNFINDENFLPFPVIVNLNQKFLTLPHTFNFRHSALSHKYSPFKVKISVLPLFRYRSKFLMLVLFWYKQINLECWYNQTSTNI